MGAFVTSIVGLAAGAVLAAAARLLVPFVRPLAWSTSILVGVAGAGAGVGLARALDGSVVVGVVAALATTTIALVAATVVHHRLRRHRADRPTAELLAAGEGQTVEFKSTARRNLHTRERDPHIEQVIVKSVAGFLNAGGGTLLIGVDDAGRVVGLDEDYPLMKAATDDAYELWLRDVLTAALGTPATASVRVRFEDHGDRRLCRVDVPASPRPVFLTPPKSQDRQLWVRTGNSTRQLRTDEAVEYHRRRWA